MAARYRLEHTDALGWLAKRRAGSIHAVVTDPPYGVVEYTDKEQKQLKQGKGLWRLPQSYDGVERKAVPRFTVLSQAQHRAIYEFHQTLAASLFRVVVPGAHVIVASNTLFSHLVVEGFVEAGFELRGQIARLVRTLRGGDRPKNAHHEFADISVSPRSSWEPWLVLRSPITGLVSENLRAWGTGGLRRPSEHSPFSDVIASGPARGEERRLSSHPSLKPQAFLRQVVRAALPLGKGVLLDPFMGSGSTVAAASSVGLYAIGLERDRTYFRQALTSVPELRALP
jgi:DNA modification methylase